MVPHPRQAVNHHVEISSAVEPARAARAPLPALGPAAEPGSAASDPVTRPARLRDPVRASAKTLFLEAAAAGRGRQVQQGQLGQADEQE